MREYEIVEMVYKSKTDQIFADQLIRQYLPFIKSEAAKFTGHPLIEGEDDELSIAMFAFHEAIMGYNKLKGTFLSFAAMEIRHRLIDYYRKEKRHHGLVALDAPIGEEEQTLLDTIEANVNEVEERQVRSAAKDEIMEFAEQLKAYGLSLADIAENCPKQKRTLQACHIALEYARDHVDILENMMDSKKIPLTKLANGSGVKMKTLERHRRYMIAILLAYTNGFEIIRGHLRQISPKKGEM